MVTVAENGKEFYGKSTDTKPLHYGSGISIPIPNGAVFVEMDTSTVYVFITILMELALI